MATVVRSLEHDLQEEDVPGEEPEDDITPAQLEAWAASEEMLPEILFSNDVTSDVLATQMTRFEEEYLALEEQYPALNRRPRRSAFKFSAAPIASAPGIPIPDPTQADSSATPASQIPLPAPLHPSPRSEAPPSEPSSSQQAGIEEAASSEAIPLPRTTHSTTASACTFSFQQHIAPEQCAADAHILDFQKRRETTAASLRSLLVGGTESSERLSSTEQMRAVLPEAVGAKAWGRSTVQAGDEPRFGHIFQNMVVADAYVR